MFIGNKLWEDLKARFSLLPDKDDEATIIQSVSDDVEFKGVRVWILICAIFTASLGLNVNSTAVIIGAMLISPLMNPIVGIGLGLGIYDIELIRKSLRSLGVMTLISIVTATLYFWLSPLSQLQSELLARTQPTIYDVFIAFVGGIAGFLANSSRFKGNIIMGVAIATALMPPLCTAGYGLSQGNMSYFFGASYLFTINATFIALSTLIVVRLMHFSPVRFVSAEREKRIRHWVIAITVCVAVPSIYSGYHLVRESIREDAVNRFVRAHLSDNDRQALPYSLHSLDSLTYLEVPLIGRFVDSLEQDSLERIMRAYYGLGEVQLRLRQSFMSSQDSADLVLGKQLISQELYQRQEEFIRRKEMENDSLLRLLRHTLGEQEDLAKTASELKVLFPSIHTCRLIHTDLGGKDLMLLIYEAEQTLEASDTERITAWLRTRLGESMAIRYYHTEKL